MFVHELGYVVDAIVDDDVHFLFGGVFGGDVCGGECFGHREEIRRGGDVGRLRYVGQDVREAQWNREQESAVEVS